MLAAVESRVVGSGISVQPVAAFDALPYETAGSVAPAAVRLPSAVRAAPRRRLSGTTLVSVAAIAGVAALGLGAWSFVSVSRSEPSAAALTDSLAGRTVALLADPRTERYPFAGAKRRIVLVVGRDEGALLVLDGLGRAPEGRAYEAWLDLAGRKPARAAVFSGARAVVPLRARVPRGATVTVTLERAGGVRQPTRAAKLVATRS